LRRPDHRAAEVRPLLNTILANWYWQYFQMNRWRFMQRTGNLDLAGRGLHLLGSEAPLRSHQQRFSTAPSPNRAG